MWKFSTPPLKILIRLKILTPLKKCQDLDPSTPMRKSQFMKNFEPWENLNPSTAIKLNHPENISPPPPPGKNFTTHEKNLLKEIILSRNNLNHS